MFIGENTSPDKMLLYKLLNFKLFQPRKTSNTLDIRPKYETFGYTYLSKLYLFIQGRLIYPRHIYLIMTYLFIHGIFIYPRHIYISKIQLFLPRYSFYARIPPPRKTKQISKNITSFKLSAPRKYLINIDMYQVPRARIRY